MLHDVFVADSDIVRVVNAQAMTAATNNHGRGQMWLCARHWRINATALRSRLVNVCFEFAELELCKPRRVDGVDEVLALIGRCHKLVSVKSRTRLRDVTHANP
jgi:hypothetical protein